MTSTTRDPIDVMSSNLLNKIIDRRSTATTFLSMANYSSATSLCSEYTIQDLTIEEISNITSVDKLINEKSGGCYMLGKRYDDRIVEDPTLIKPPENRNVITIVLDFDETLVNVAHKGYRKYTDNVLTGICNLAFIESVQESLTTGNLSYYIRPGVRKFLREMSVNPDVEVIAWTAGNYVHARRVLEILDPDSKVVKQAICRGDSWFLGSTPYKTTCLLEGRDPALTILIDDSPIVSSINTNADGITLLVPCFKLTLRSAELLDRDRVFFGLSDIIKSSVSIVNELRKLISSVASDDSSTSVVTTTSDAAEEECGFIPPRLTISHSDDYDDECSSSGDTSSSSESEKLEAFISRTRKLKKLKNKIDDTISKLSSYKKKNALTNCYCKTYLKGLSACSSLGFPKSGIETVKRRCVFAYLNGKNVLFRSFIDMPYNSIINGTTTSSAAASGGGSQRQQAASSGKRLRRTPLDMYVNLRWLVETHPLVANAFSVPLDLAREVMFTRTQTPDCKCGNYTTCHLCMDGISVFSTTGTAADTYLYLLDT